MFVQYALTYDVSLANLSNITQKRGYYIGMITGDNKLTAQAIGKQVGIDIIFAEVTPEEKYLKVKELQEQGKNVASIELLKKLGYKNLSYVPSLVNTVGSKSNDKTQK